MTLVRWALAGWLLCAGGCTLPDRRLDAVRDPVCGRIVEKKSAAANLTYLRKVYYFDSEDCLKTFDAHPARYCDVASALYPEYDY